MSKFWSWLVTSSENPQNVSLTVKGALGTLISVIVVIAPLLHWGIGIDQLNNVANIIVQIIGYALGIISVIATIAGLARKLWLTLKPTTSTPLAVAPTAPIVPAPAAPTTPTNSGLTGV